MCSHDNDVTGWSFVCTNGIHGGPMMYDRMLFAFALVIVTGRCPAQTVDQDTLPRGPRPIQVLAMADHGILTVKSPATYWAPKMTPDPNNKGAFITQYEMRGTNLQARTYPLEKVKAYDVRGNPIGAKRLGKL